MMMSLLTNALALVALAVVESPGVGLLYSDEDKIDVQRRSDLIRTSNRGGIRSCSSDQNYLTHFLVVRRDVLSGVIGGLRIGLKGAQDWDLVYPDYGVSGR